MPIKSYIAIPKHGKKAKLLGELDSLKGCETVPAENKEVIVVITETESDEQDKTMQDNLNTLEYLAHLTMVAGYETDSI